MKVKSLNLVNYKNYRNQSFDFNANLITVLGNNGMGKTNILDAIYYACIGKSYFTSSDRNVTNHTEDFFRIESEFENDSINNVVIKVKPGKLKKIEVNDILLDKISDHIGSFPIVIVAPIDIQILLEGSEDRRLFMNNSIIQYSKKFLHDILVYNRLLKQRNALLKQFQERKYFDPTLLNVISMKMVDPAASIFKFRQEFVQYLSPIFESTYKSISNDQEQCKLDYKSQLHKHNLMDLFNDNLEKDRVLGRTTCGVHRDDLNFVMGGEKLKTFASQGQLKTYILALKLAQFEVLNTKLGICPILLFDDLFDKLDENRVTFLLELITSGKYGQVFISDTSANRIPEILDKMSKPYQCFIINKGETTKQYEKK